MSDAVRRARDGRDGERGPGRERLRRLARRLGIYRPLSRLHWRLRRKRVAVLHEAPTVSLRLCYGAVLGELAAASGREWLLRHVDEVRAEDLHAFHAVVFPRTVSPRSLELLRAARAEGCRTIYDADDNVLLLDQMIADPDNPWRRHFDRARPELEALLREADLIKLYHPAAAPYFRGYNPHLAWAAAPHTSFAAPRPGAASAEPVTVGLLGSAYKDEELRPVVAAIRRLLAEGHPLRFEVFGFPPEALRAEARVTVIPWRSDYDEYRRTLESRAWDVGLAPLRDLPFNRCKTDAKYRELGSARIAGVYADMPVYREVVRQRETGLLVDHEDEGAWRAAILELARDGELRGRIQEAAVADVRARYRPDRYAAAVAALLEGPLPRPPVEPAP